MLHDADCSRMMVVEELDVAAVSVDLWLRHGQVRRLRLEHEVHMMKALVEAAPDVLDITTMYDEGVLPPSVL